MVLIFGEKISLKVIRCGVFWFWIRLVGGDCLFFFGHMVWAYVWAVVFAGRR